MLQRRRKQGWVPIVSFISSSALRTGILLTVGSIPVGAQSAHVLSGINKIYVEPLGHGKLGEELRDRVVNRLHKKANLIIVETPGKADAVMSGTAEVWVTSHASLSPRSPATTQRAVYSGFLSVRIVSTDKEVLWSYLVTPGRFAWGGIVNDLADNLTAKLLEARKEREEIPSSQHSDSSLLTIHGAGATFPAPLYQKWFQSIEEQQPKQRITYDAVGSEAGIGLLAEGKVDFAASDMPLSDERMAQSGARWQHFASVLGAVVPIYNLRGVARPLNFTPEVLAEIYLGKIRRWNDPRIHGANRGVSLPDSEIVVVRRSDGSGTTFVWSDFLSKISPEWKSTIGRGSELNWAVGRGAEHNEGVALMVERTPNAIGYVEMVFALQHQLSFGAVRNPAGVFVRADLSSVREAAATAEANMTSDFRVSITNAPGTDAYPIASFTWLLLPNYASDPNRNAALHGLVEWILTFGQKQCSELGYAPLPPEVVRRELELLRSQK